MREGGRRVPGIGIKQGSTEKSRSASVRAECFFTTESAEGTETGKERVRNPDPNPFFLFSLRALRASAVKTSKPNSRGTFA